MTSVSTNSKALHIALDLIKGDIHLKNRKLANILTKVFRSP